MKLCWYGSSIRSLKLLLQHVRWYFAGDHVRRASLIDSTFPAHVITTERMQQTSAERILLNRDRNRGKLMNDDAKGVLDQRKMKTAGDDS